MKKKKKSFPKKPALILTAAALLLVGSTVGSTRAALTYYSENYSAQMNMQSIGVSLLENDKVVSSRDYVSNNEWKGTSEGELLTDLLGKDDTFTPGKKYNEAINVKNSGTIDTFVRVIITKSWQDKEGKKNTTLSPDLIELNFQTMDGKLQKISPPQNVPFFITQRQSQQEIRHQHYLIPFGLIRRLQRMLQSM